MRMGKTFALACLLALSCIAFANDLPPLPGSSLKINVVDKANKTFVPSVLTVGIDYSAPYNARSYEYEVNMSKQGQEVPLLMPPSEYDALISVFASAPGYQDSSLLLITSDEYWKAVAAAAGEGSENWNAVPTGVGEDFYAAAEAPKTYLKEHTFELEKKRAGGQGKLCPFMLVFAALVPLIFLLERRGRS